MIERIYTWTGIDWLTPVESVYGEIKHGSRTVCCHDMGHKLPSTFSARALCFCSQTCSVLTEYLV